MCHKTLPENYIYHDTIDLKNNKKHFWIVMGLGLVLCAVLIAVGWCIVRLPYIYDFIEQEENLGISIAAIATVVVGSVLYIIGHEAVHGLYMYLFCRAKIKYGFVGWAAYAGSSAYYDKMHYVVISLAPVTIWGIVFAILNVFFHEGIWFWVIWILQIANISGAAGDFFCAVKVLTYPKDILVCDSGMDMKVYRKMTDEEAAKAANLNSENETESTAENGEAKFD